MLAEDLIASAFCIVVGIALRRLPHPPAAHDLIRDVILKVALPASVLTALLSVRVTAEWSLLPLLMIAWSLTLLAGLTLVSRLRSGGSTPAQARTMAVVLPSNASGLAIFPFVDLALGREGLAQAAAGHVGCIAFYIVGAPLIALALSRRGSTPTAGPNLVAAGLQRLLLEPVALSALLATILVWLNVELTDLPPASQRLLDMLAGMLAPLVLIYVGMTFTAARARLAVILQLLSLRMALSLIFAAAALTVVPLGAILPIIVVVLSMGPPALYTVALVSSVGAGHAGRSARPFDPAFAGQIYAVALPAAMVAAVIALSFDCFSTEPRVLVALGVIQLALVLALRRRQPRPRRLPRRSAGDQDRSKVVDVGERRADL